MRTCLILLPFLLLTACGAGGSSSGGTTAIQTVTHYYASGRIQDTGQIVTATGKRTGTWTTYHDLDGSPLQFTGDYVDGALDVTKAWKEWNADGSVRADSSDR